MRTLTNKKSSIEDQKRILTKALLSLASRLNLSREELSNIIGLSGSTLSRVYNQTAFINPSAKEGQLTLLLVRLYKSLDALFGGNEKQCQQWLRASNNHLNNTPISLIQSIEGLVLVVQYLDAMRERS